MRSAVSSTADAKHCTKLAGLLHRSLCHQRAFLLQREGIVSQLEDSHSYNAGMGRREKRRDKGKEA